RSCRDDLTASGDAQGEQARGEVAEDAPGTERLPIEEEGELVEIALQVLLHDRGLMGRAAAFLELACPEGVVWSAPEQVDPVFPRVILLARREVVTVEA